MSSEEENILKGAKKLPWEERLLHKNWKVRNEANIDLASLCDSITDPKDQRLREFGPLFRKTVADANAPVQEKALDALIAFLQAADADSGRFAKEICDAIAAKCLNGRPKTVEKSQAAFLLWIELEATDVFLDTMEKATKNKVSKAVVPAIDVMFQALSEFGSKIVPAKRILKMLPELLDHQDQNVRASSKGLTLELCRWIGKDPVKSILFEKMRDTMKKELEAELVNFSGNARPSRKIRAEQGKEPDAEAASEVVCSGPSQESANDVSQEIDEYDLVDPVDILSPLDKSVFWDRVKAAKWSERKEAIAELTKLASTKRIAPGDFTEVCRTLKKLIKDVNIAVAVEAIHAIGNLASGLRTHFSGSSRFLLPVLLEKLKEKKPTLTESLTQTLETIHKAGCLSLVEVTDEVKAAVKNKVPLVRKLSLNWVTYCIETSNKAVVLKLHKDYVPIFMECLLDGTPDVRDAAFSALAAIAKCIGMSPLERSIEKLDDVRKKKLSEMIAGSSVKGQHANGNMSSLELTEVPFVKKTAASMLGKKPIQVAPVTKKGGAVKSVANKKGDGRGQTKASKVVETEDVEPIEMGLEEIERRLGSLLTKDTISQLKSTVWKERLEAIGSLKQQVEAFQELDQSVEILISLLCAVPGWSEKNVQVQQQVIEVIAYIASTASNFPKKCIVLCLFGISERVADIKTRAFAMKCLSTFCEAAGPGFVFERLYKILKEHKNPKVLSEGILWMVSAIEDFGLSHLKLKDLIDFCKDTGLQSSAAATRNATIKLIGSLHKYVGPDIKGYLADVKPALLSALDAEYEKSPFEGATAVSKKTVRTSDSTLAACGPGGLPREDISGMITPDLLKGLQSTNWKVRLESIETVNRILQEANKRIQPTGTLELFGALRGRLNDTNKNLVMTTLSTLGGVASAMGPAVEKTSKGILSDVLKCLADNKKHMRECTLATLDSWMTAVQLDKMIPYITTTLTDTKIGAEGRKDLFDWLSRQLSGLNNSSDAVHLLNPVVSAMTDKVSDVRKAAETCFAEILRICGHETVTKNMKDMHGPASALVLERLKPRGALQGLLTDNIAVALVKGSRVVSSRAIPTRSSRSDSIMSVQDISIQSQPLLHVKDSNKEHRERMVVRRFKFEELRIEQIQDLEKDLMKYFREDLHRRLLSTDFKKQVDGLEMLQKALPLIRKDIGEVLDILMKWIVLRFCESNTTCLLKVLEFLPELFDLLRDESYPLTESEAAIILPCLTEKSGHNIEKVREKMRELTKQIVNIYPATKVFPYILEGLRSKNNRTRIECADHVGFLIEHHGAEIYGQLKSLQIVASLTAERDGELRKAALNSLATGYKLLGDDIWRYVGKLTDAQKSMLDDRFKWKAREMDKRKEGKPGEHRELRAILRRSVKENGCDVAELSRELSGSIAGPILSSSMENYAHSDVSIGRHIIPNILPTPKADGPTDWKEALDFISFSSLEQSVEGMKFVCHELTQLTSDPEGSSMDDIAKDTDRLVSCLANKVSRTFNFSLTGAPSRSCRYVLNTLLLAFQNKKVAHAVKESTLDSLITGLLMWLLDERVPGMDDGSQLLKSLNILMLKILENADITSSFAVLINLLGPLDPSRWPSPPSVETFAVRNQKFSDLVVKCLVKLTKALPSTIYEVDLDRIQEIGMEEIRRRAGADDKPLRMVKTLLHELVKIQGTAIEGHLSMVPINVQAPSAARILTPSGPVGHTQWGDSTANNPSPTAHSADAQLKQELAAIFKKIGDKRTCEIGIYELYRITQLYPKVDIFAQLQNTSEAFQTYIRDGLSQMEKNAAMGRTPTSLLMSNPPLVTLNSPKFASISPVHTKSLIEPKMFHAKAEPTNFALPPSFTEDGQAYSIASSGPTFEQQMGDRRNERFPSGVASGTLDAIRERMKSIQLSVTGGYPDCNKTQNSVQNSVLPMDQKALSRLQVRMERLKSHPI